MEREKVSDINIRYQRENWQRNGTIFPHYNIRESWPLVVKRDKTLFQWPYLMVVIL